MADTDDAARGRAAALEVRRSKKQERQAFVRKHYPGWSTTKIAAELGCAQSTIANDVKELGLSAPVGPRRKHPEPKPRRCEECGRTFTPKDASQDVRGYGKLCSEECKRHRGGLRAATERHRRADKRLERMNEAGYVTMRQVADELPTSEANAHRCVELGYLEVGSLRLVEGEWWRLVRREELERFKADDWPALRRAHAEKLLEDSLRGYPAMPSTWSAETRRRHARRRDALRERGRRCTPKQEADALDLLRQKVSIRKTADATGLSKHQVEDLKAENLSP